MIDYNRFSLRTLRQMCRGQFLRVTPSSGLSPTQQDYINTLKAAAAPPQNTFMTLPGELRNMIYREMLIFKNHDPNLRPSCSPQILACNRQIHDEATDILYEENVLVIELNEISMRTHSHRCGKYSTSGTLKYREGYPPSSEVQIGSVKWPAFLLKAPRVDFKVGPLIYGRATRGFDASFKIDINHVLYSLCSFWSARGSLRHFSVDLRWPGNNILPRKLEEICYPLVMLGNLKSLKIRTTDTNIIEFADATYTNPSITGTLHVGSVLSPALAIVDEAKAYMSLANAVRLDTQQHSLHPTQALYPADWVRLRDALDALLELLDSMNGSSPATGQTRMCDAVWEQNVSTATNELQQAFDSLDVFSLFIGNPFGSNYDDVVEMLEGWKKERQNFSVNAGKGWSDSRRRPDDYDVAC